MSSPPDNQELDLAPPVDEDDMSTPFMEEKERVSTIVFLITTMREIRLQDQLARTYFREVYCGLPCHKTVHGFARRLVHGAMTRARLDGTLEKGTQLFNASVKPKCGKQVHMLTRVAQQ
jgi:hypothetical protein